MSVPHFIIIGSQRCGTTSLYSALATHKMITPAAVKEVHYFDDNYTKGWQWYLDQLQPGGSASSSTDPAILGEASPYYVFHPLVAQRIRQCCPQVKLILLLRNPVDRAYSHYNHEVRRGVEPLPFDEALRFEKLRLSFEKEKQLLFPEYSSLAYRIYSYVARGIYVKQVRRWFRLFPRDQMLILKSEELFADPNTHLKKITDFLGLRPFDDQAFEWKNRLDYAPMDESVRSRLKGFFRPYNDSLAHLLGWASAWD